ncbi:hypothetical protein J6590_058472 [Homalodisca vitripennis]|nr:hypothetical protein J6590_058472 [Homalodisca vitripennis]
MKLITTGNCCFCFSLRTGSLILGWLQLLAAIITIIGNIIIKTQDDGSSQNTANSALFNSNSFWPNIVVALIQLAMAVCLLYGIYAERKNYVLYYVYFQFTIIVLSIIIFIVLLATSSVDSVIVSIITYLISWLLQAYFAIVVYSLYREMGGDN